MNKNHLLPALLFVLAACGPATSSSAPVSSSSAAADNNQYRFIGSQTNIGGWSPANAPVMTRATATNSFTWTGDLYADSTWKLVIGTDWANGEVVPLSSGLSITDKGVVWTKDAQGAIVVPANSNTTTDPGVGGVGNFKTLVNGNYTVTFVSLPALSRTFTIVRNGNPTVVPPSITDWALFGTINGWTASDMSFKLVNDKNENKAYSLTLNLNKDEQFKFVKNGGNPLWGGDLGFSTLVSPVAADVINSDGNIKIVRDGSFTVSLNFGVTTSATVTRVADLVRPAGGLHLVGDIQTTPWTTTDTSLALTEVGTTGTYYGVFSLGLHKEFKVKNGLQWNVGFDAGFDKVAAFPTGAFESWGGGQNIRVLDGTATVSRSFIINVRVVGSSVRIVITPAWTNFSFPTLTYAPTTGATSIGYLNTTNEFWNANAQLRIYGTFDATKTKVNFEYTGVATHEYMFKIEKLGGGPNKEARSVATGSKQTFVLDISSISAADRAKLNLLVVFHTAPTNPVSGTLIIHGVSYAS
jgi:hypothetical protein